MGELALDRLQGHSGDHQDSRQVFGCGICRIGLLLLPGKKKNLEQKESELGAHELTQMK